MKEFLSQKGVSFEEVDVSMDEQAREEMVAKTGTLAVPVTEVGEEAILGFDREKLSTALAEAGIKEGL